MAEVRHASALAAALYDAANPPALPPDADLPRVALTLADGSVIKGRLLPQPAPLPSPRQDEPILLLVGPGNARVWVSRRFVMAVDAADRRGDITPAHLRLAR